MGKKIFICYVNDISLSDIIMKIQSHNMDKHMTISKCEYQLNYYIVAFKI